MRREAWDELFDQDVETLIAGGTPANTDLQPMRVFVAELRSLANEETSDEFIEFHAAESAATAAAWRTAMADPPPDTASRLSGVRRKVSTVAASLALVLGSTGVVWAADGAVPGDWYYEFDLALESIGVGAGGVAERLDEQQKISETAPETQGDDVGSTDVAPATTVEPTGLDESATTVTDEPTGLDQAATTVTDAPNRGGASDEARARVVDRLNHLSSVEGVEGSVVSEMAKQVGSPLEWVRPRDHAGKPDDVARPVARLATASTGHGRQGNKAKGGGAP